MVDKPVGSAGTLRITDNGSVVSFIVLCSDPATNVGTYRYAINGVPGSTDLPAGFGSRVLGTRTITSSQTVTLSQEATGTQGLGGASTLSTNIVRNPPAEPSVLSVTRVSDTQHTLNWSRNSTYTSVVVHRRVGDGPSWSEWQQIGIAAGNAFTFTDSTTFANRRFQYRVAGRAASGQSAWSGATNIDTTPAAPTGVVAVRVGDDIQVTASSVPPYGVSFDIEDDGTVIASSVSMPFTHVSPSPSVPHKYRVRGKTAADLVGVWSAVSNTVQLLAPPNAPAGLTPNGGVVPSDADTVLRWTHNPVDSSAQSAYELRYRVPAGAWTTLTGTTAQQRAVALPEGAREWQVRTKGTHPDWSPWSSVAAFSVVDRPGVAVVQPVDEWDASILTANWSWFQAQSRPQSAWRADLLDATLRVVESKSGSGAASSTTFSERLSEGTWTVRVRAATGDVWSVWAQEQFDVLFDEPAPPVLNGAWDDAQGGVVLAVGSGIPAGAELDGNAWFVDFER